MLGHNQPTRRDRAAFNPVTTSRTCRRSIRGTYTVNATAPSRSGTVRLTSTDAKTDPNATVTIRPYVVIFASVRFPANPRTTTRAANAIGVATVSYTHLRAHET